MLVPVVGLGVGCGFCDFMTPAVILLPLVGFGVSSGFCSAITYLLFVRYKTPIK